MYLYDHLLILALLYRISLLQFRCILLFFILSYIFILEIGLSVYVTLSNILSWLTPVMNFGLLYSHVILTMSLLLHHAFLWENINERYPNTFG
jgi:hypothetical protein